MFRLFCACSALMLLAFLAGVILSVETKNLLSHLWAGFLHSIGYVRGPAVPVAFQEKAQVAPATPAEIARMEKNIMTVLKS